MRDLLDHLGRLLVEDVPLYNTPQHVKVYGVVDVEVQPPLLLPELPGRVALRLL